MIIFLLLGAFNVFAQPKASEEYMKNIEKMYSNTFYESISEGVVEWTYLFYDDSDFISAYEPLEDFCKDAFSGENLHVIVLEDTYDGTANIWYINEDHEKILLEELGEVDMGDCTTLEFFIRYGKENFTANRYLLALYNHGGGWMGACIDDTDGGVLKMNDINQAIMETGGVDIICFTAPCLMGSLESVYELRDAVDVYIGSEELSYYLFWMGTTYDICVMLNNETDLNNYEIGERIIHYIETRYIQHFYGKELTMSAIRTDKIGELKDGIDDLVHEIHDNFRLNSLQNIKSARDSAFSLGWDSAELFDLIDLYGFIENLQGFKTTDELMDSINECIIAECHGSNQSGCNGLSIFFPDSVLDYLIQMNYRGPNEALDFARDTHWDEFLMLYTLYNFIL